MSSQRPPPEEDELEKRAPSLLGYRTPGHSDDEDSTAPRGDEELTLVSASELQILQETFSLFDKDGDGCVTTEELGTVMQCIGHSLTSAQLKELLRRIDKDGNGTIEFDEFIQLIKSERRRRHQLGRGGGRAGAAGRRRELHRSGSGSGMADDSEDELLAAFRVFDKDQNGYISASELRDVMEALGHVDFTLAEAREMLREVDINGDGLIDYTEFVTMLTASPSRVPSRLSSATVSGAEASVYGRNVADTDDGVRDCDSTKARKSDD